MGWIQAPAVFVKCPNILLASVKWLPLPRHPVKMPACVFWVASGLFSVHLLLPRLSASLLCSFSSSLLGLPAKGEKVRVSVSPSVVLLSSDVSALSVSL